MSRPRLLVAWLALAAVGTVLLGGVAFLEARERTRLGRELARLREEIRARLDQAEHGRDRVVVRAPFATWAHLVAGLHEAAAASRLDRFRYVTLGVVPVTDPTAPVPVTAHDEEVSRGNEGRRAAKKKGRDATPPYRAMRARVEGSGTYGQVVSFVRALASVDPPLRLDRIIVRAGPGGPSFEAYVHLVTALPVEDPRVVSLDRLPVPLPPELGDTLASLGLPRPPEVTR